MEELYDNVIKKLQKELHPDDFQDLMRGKIKKQIIEMVIREYTDLGITDLDFITNRVRDRFGLGFDPNSSIGDKVLRDLEYMLDYEHNLKGASANKIFKNEFETIERMEGEKSAAIAKQMIDQYRFKVRNNMKLKEAKDLMENQGYLVEYINKEEVSPEKYDLIQEILDDPLCDSDLDYYTLADWSIDDLENYKNELADLHNEERYADDPYRMNEATKGRSRYKYDYKDLKGILNAVFMDDILDMSKTPDVYIGHPMREYDVSVKYEWDKDTDTLTCSFNYGDAALEFKDFTKHFEVIEKGWLNSRGETVDWVVKCDVALEDFKSDVDDEWRECFEY